MQSSKFNWRISSLFLAMGLISFIGCGAGGSFTESVVEEANKTNVQKIANCYAMYQFGAGKSFKGPEDKEMFLKFLAEEKNRENLEKMGIDPANIDAIFTSERDNEEIKVRWGLVGSSRGSKEPVAFESTGVDGTRFVAFTDSNIKEVTDSSEYDSMLSGKFVAESNTGAVNAPDNAADVGKNNTGEIPEDGGN